MVIAFCCPADQPSQCSHQIGDGPYLDPSALNYGIIDTDYHLLRAASLPVLRSYFRLHRIIQQLQAKPHHHSLLRAHVFDLFAIDVPWHEQTMGQIEYLQQQV